MTIAGPATTRAPPAKCAAEASAARRAPRSSPHSVTPVDVVGLGTGVLAVRAGAEHTCAIIAGGTAKCWGDNSFGQLGDGSGQTSSSPVDVAGLTGVVEIAPGDEHTCARLASGAVKCWGDNSLGQLGNGTYATSTRPVDVAGLASGVDGLAAGGYHTCARVCTGGVMCWGDNAYGALGNGSTASSRVPVSVFGLDAGVTALAAGEVHTSALDARGHVLWWGAVASNTAHSLLAPTELRLE